MTAAALRAAIVAALRARFPGATCFVTVAQRPADRRHRARAVAEVDGFEGDPFEAFGPWRDYESAALAELARGVGALPQPAPSRTAAERQRAHRARRAAR